MSRRDGAIVAWHEVPGTAPPHESRPVGYGVIRAGLRADSGNGHYIEQQLEHHRTPTFREEYLASVKKHSPTFRREIHPIPLRFAAPDHTVPYGTVLSRDAFPRHFVPGYDRCCPYGTRLQTLRNSSSKVITFGITVTYSVRPQEPGSDTVTDSTVKYVTLFPNSCTKLLRNVPEGRCDRSLARSAWDGAAP
jgi:hypothetical protein